MRQEALFYAGNLFSTAIDSADPLCSPLTTAALRIFMQANL